ncbi:MAG: hypothetical protein JW720_06950 [Sedimentisphaerales bacterium]|nr:hypothetical protein [Sedimentisphaerales bacterium]
MTTNTEQTDVSLNGTAETGVPYGSNCLRLSLGEWFAVGLVVAATALAVPALWPVAERFEPGENYRIPYSMSNDYYLFGRYAEWAAGKYDTLVVGDSVIWGHYVSRGDTLASQLNRLVGKGEFANLGVDGIHPAALEGLLRYYGKAVSGKNVILHLNLLWMSSPRHDLQTDKEHHFNHPQLVPQFAPRIPCYKASFADRASVAVGRRVPLFSWVSHIDIAYFQGSDVPAWSIEHPYDCPFRAVTFRFAASDEYERNAEPADPSRDTVLDWVDLETSLQWRFFKSAVELLRQRGNRVFVVLGPFNEHLLAPQSLDAYRKMQAMIESWFREKGIPCFVPDVLPGEYYCDASHPLGEGYAELARRLVENESFWSAILRSKP